MAANVVIRPGTAADLPAVKRIYDTYIETSTATFDTAPSDAAMWREKLGCLYVACDARESAGRSADVVGFAYAAPFRPRAAYERTVETTIYLTAAAAGRGVGRRLYSTLLDRVDADGFHTAVAVIALPNPGSVALHESLGFVEAGVLREVGHKFGTYVDTAFYQRLNPGG